MKTGPLVALCLALVPSAAPAGALVPPQTELRDRMRAAGLERIEAVDDGGRVARGFLPGEAGSTVLLFAGCGPGGEASRRAALVAATDLARTPRRHTLELVACAGGGAGPDTARRAARSWLDLHPDAAARDAVLAVLHLEPGDPRSGTAVGLVRAGAGARGRRLPPAWLAHAVLEGGRAGGARLAIGDPGWPVMGQLLGRYGRTRRTSGSEPFLGAGLPALTLSGGGAEPGWSVVLAATVRRLDSLAGRPRDDDVFLALAGRVWSRRNLYWAGLAAFGVLLAAGLPGAWRGAGSDQRRRRGRRYLPGFLFRMLFLVALLLAPAATMVLLAPAALATLLPLRGRWAVRAGRALAAGPAVLFAGYWVAAVAAGSLNPWPAQPERLLLVLSGVALAVRLTGRRRDERRNPRRRSIQHELH